MLIDIHHKTVASLQKKLQEAHRAGNSVTVSRSTGQSNTTRSDTYKKNTHTVSINNFNKILKLDQEKGLALVEPNVSVYELAQATLSLGLIPKVVPEFKGITVGGAVMGTALESSSYRFGQFNDICTRYELLLGNGALVNASASENSDLFYGLAGSYGTLGLLTSIEVELKPAQPWIALTYRRFDHPAKMLGHLKALYRSPNPPDYIEGILFSKSDCMVIEGRQPEKDQLHTLPRTSTLGRFDAWFIKHASEKQTDSQELIPCIDYLFRYDKGAFWMGYYLMQIPLLCRHLFRRSHRFLEKLKATTAQLQDRFLKAAFLPRVLGSLMDSQHLYATLHTIPENWFATTFVVQDFYIPEESVEIFIDQVCESTAITPLWLCPIRGTNTPQILSPHLSHAKPPQMFVNVGVYGMPKKDLAPIEATRYLEQQTKLFGGKKMLYSQSYYSEEAFWEIYSLPDYQQLRRRYFADKTWLPITAKILN
jgi:hypothetical protein